jgi:hypothetical protein
MVLGHVPRQLGGAYTLEVVYFCGLYAGPVLHDLGLYPFFLFFRINIVGVNFLLVANVVLQVIEIV